MIVPLICVLFGYIVSNILLFRIFDVLLNFLLSAGLKWWRQRQQTRAMQRLRGGRSVAPRMPSESWGDEPPILTVTIFALDAPIDRDKATQQLNVRISKIFIARAMYS